MAGLTITTFDWVPPPPRGFVRDLRLRWALEEADLPYRVATIPFEQRHQPTVLPFQPFGQVPWLTDGDLTLFESGAILLHLGERSARLLPRDRHGRSRTIQWMFAALNSVEIASLPWALRRFGGGTEPDRLDEFLTGRLDSMEAVLAATAWLAGGFSAADILMADVLRLVDRFGGLAVHPACRAYVARATARPCFGRALEDQMALFAAGDAARAQT